MTASMDQKNLEGSYVFQYLAAFTAYLSIITSGMHYGWPSPSLPTLLDKNDTSTFTLTNDEGSWIAVMPLFGSMVGSFMVAGTVDMLGRKRTILLNCIPFAATWAVIAFSNSFVMVSIARFMAGVSDGFIFTAAPMYIGEIADPKIRGFLGSAASLSWIFGILLINIIGSYLSIQTTALISLTLPVVCLFTFCWMPESAYQLVMHNKKDEAKKSLQKLRGVEDVSEELDRINEAIQSQSKKDGSFWDLFTIESNRKALYVMLGLRTTQQLCGTTAITFYTQPIFKEAGDAISPELATIAYFTVQLFCVCFCAGLVDKAGRRPLLMISISGAAISLFLEGTYFYLKICTSVDLSQLSWLPMAGLIMFVVTFSLGMQSIPILTLGELFHPNVKAFALCLADVFFCIVAIIASKFFQYMKDSLGMFVPFYAFSFFSVVGLVFIILCMPETKGKTLEEIQEYFKGNSSSKSKLGKNEIIIA